MRKGGTEGRRDRRTERRREWRVGETEGWREQASKPGNQEARSGQEEAQSCVRTRLGSHPSHPLSAQLYVLRALLACRTGDWTALGGWKGSTSGSWRPWTSSSYLLRGTTVFRAACNLLFWGHLEQEDRKKHQKHVTSLLD